MSDPATSQAENSAPAKENITITVKSQKERETFTVSPNDDVKILREKVAEKFKVEPAAVCLIFSGKILRDGGAINSHNLEDGHIIHMVIRDPKSSAPSAQTTNTTSTPTGNSSGGNPSTDTISNNNSGTSTTPGSGGMFDLFNSMMGNNLFGNLDSNASSPGGGAAAATAGIFNNPDLLNQMLNNPMVEQMASNPELIQNIISNTPGFRDLMDRNPEFGQMLRSPDLFRQSLNLMRNPAAMQEMMRNRDRAMSNLESMPGGFNALRRMYTEMEEPMFQALSSRSPFESTNNGNTANANSTPNTTENRDPLPNPWDRSSTTPSSGNTNNNTNRSSNTPFDAASLLGGSGGIQQMMRQLTSNPDTMRNIMSSMGNFGGNLPNMDQFSNQIGLTQRILGNPEAFQAFLDIQNAHARFERALGISMVDLIVWSFFYRNLNSTGASSGTTNTATNTTSGQQGTTPNTTNSTNPTASATGNAGTIPNANMLQNMSQLMNMLNSLGSGGTAGGLGGMGGLGTGTGQSQQPPEERFASQLQQLESMGFTNRERNIRALVQTFGNVEAAIEIILLGP